MRFYSSCSNTKPLENEENHGSYFIRHNIVYDEDAKLYRYEEALCSEDEYDVYILKQRQLEALEAIAELYELIAGGEQ